MKNTNILTTVADLQPGDNWTFFGGSMCTVYKVEPSQEDYKVDVYYIMFEKTGEASACKMTEFGRSPFVANRPE